MPQTKSICRRSLCSPLRKEVPLRKAVRSCFLPKLPVSSFIAASSYQSNGAFKLEQPNGKFLNTCATNYFLEELIKNAKDRLILISPFLKLNDRMKELLADKNRLKIDVRG